MTELQPADWDALRFLARESGYGDEKIDALHLQAKSCDDLPGAPYSLLLGNGEGALGLLLREWLGEGAAEALRQAGSRPVVIGREPEKVQPPLGRWPTFTCEKIVRGHLLAVSASEPLSYSLRGQLASLGAIDQAIVVTRFGQALPESEREVVRSVSDVSALARVLIVTLPGENARKDDVAKLHQFALHQMKLHGFADGRCETIGFWSPGAALEHPHAVADPGGFLEFDRSRVEAGRREMVRLGAARALKEIAAKAGGERKPLPVLSEEDLRETEESFRRALAEVEQRAQESIAAEPAVTDERVRAKVIDLILAWGSRQGMSGIWLDYLEKVRPGAEEGLFEKARGAVGMLSFERQAAPGISAEEQRAPSAGVVTALRIGIAILAGLLFYGAAELFFPGTSRVFTNLAMMLGAIGGFVVGEPLAHSLISPAKRTLAAPQAAPPRLQGFGAFSEELRAWLRGHLREGAIDIPARCHEFAKRLRLNGSPKL